MTKHIAAYDMRTDRFLRPETDYYRACVRDADRRVKILGYQNIPPSDYDRHWELEGPHA